MNNLEENPTLGEYTSILLKRKWTALTIFLMVVTFVTLRAFLIQPLYEGTAKIVIDFDKDKVVAYEEIYNTNSAHRDYLPTELNILSSRVVAEKTLNKIRTQYSKLVIKEGKKDPVEIVQSWFKINLLKRSRIVHIQAIHPDPEIAPFAANALTDAYIEFNMERKLEASNYAVAWLKKELASVLAEVKESDMKLLKYFTKHQIIHIPKIGKAETAQQGLLVELEREHARLTTLIAELYTRYKPLHPKMIRLQSSLKNVKSRIKEEVHSVLDLNKKKVEYDILKREASANKRIYQTLFDRTKETNIFEGLKTNNVSIIDRARVSDTPLSPNRRFHFLIGCLLGLMSGIGIAIGLEYLNTTIKSTEDAEEFTGIPVLGNIPEIEMAKGEAHDNANLIHRQEGSSLLAESYRFVKIGISCVSVKTPAKRILITSSSPREGKTTNAVNLATTFAAGGEKVLLIDADLRNPKIKNIFNLDSEWGLSHYLASEADTSQIICATSVPNLDVMSSGTTPPNPAELLESDKMKELLDWAAQRYSKVIVDSPPVMAVADPLILSGIIEGVLFVIRADTTNRKHVLQAINRIKETKIKILGIVLGRVHRGGSQYGYYGDYYPYEANGKHDKGMGIAKAFQNMKERGIEATVLRAFKSLIPPPFRASKDSKKRISDKDKLASKKQKAKEKVKASTNSDTA